MLKIKSLISSHKTHDKTTTGTSSSSKTHGSQSTGTGQTKSPTGGLAGEGSHLGNARDTTAGNASRIPSVYPSGTDTTTGTQGLGSSNTSSGYENTRTSGISSATGLHSSNVANKVDPRVDSGNPKLGNSGSSAITGPPNTGLGTTGTAGGLATSNMSGISSGSGVTGSNQVSSLGRDATAIGGPHTTSVANRLDPSVNTQGISKVGLEDSHHHSSVHGGGAEEADRHHGSAPSSPVGVASTPAYNTPSGHHLGGDAGVAGGVGGAAYEAEKHHNSHETGTGTRNGLPTASGNHGIGTGTGTGNAVDGETGRQGLGHGATPLDEKTRGSDLGDKLHGADRNRGVAGSSGFPSTEGYGSGTSGTIAGHHSGVIGGSRTAGQQPGGTQDFAGSGQDSNLRDTLTGIGQHSGTTGKKTNHQRKQSFSDRILHPRSSGSSGTGTSEAATGQEGHRKQSLSDRILHPRGSAVSEATTDQAGHNVGSHGTK